jgi:hypothetical protein
LSFHDPGVLASDVLSMTGTIRSWTRNFGTRVGAETALTAARLPPADEPPMVTLERSAERREAPIELSHTRASQQSCTAAG